MLRHRFPLTNIVTVGLLMTLLVAVPVSAQSLRQQSSLKFVPAETAIYLSLLRNRQQYDTFVQSKAYAKLMELPLVQKGIAEIKSQWENPSDPDLEEFKAQLAKPENQKLLELLIDGLSEEVFFQGSGEISQALALLNQFGRTMNAAVLEAAAEGTDPDDVVGAKLVELLEQHDLKVPNAIVGFKLGKTTAAGGQIDRLESILKEIFEKEAPELRERMVREKISGQDFLVLKLDGSLLPWEEMDLDELQLDEDQAKKFVQKFEKMTLAIAVGVYEDFLLVSIGETTAHLHSLGTGEKLIDRPEFAALRKHEDKPITSISYASGQFMAVAGSAERQIDDLASMAKKALPLVPFDDATKGDLRTDIDALATDIKRYLPRPGAVLGFSFLTDQGSEGYAYNWAQNLMLDGSQPLAILHHVGGHPLMFYAGRGKTSPEGYELLVKWLKKVVAYGERLGLPLAGEDIQKQYKEFREEFDPLLTRLDKANRTMLIPAMADGQSALVVDAQLTSKQPHRQLPSSETPLPLLELALVYGLSDADLLKKAFAEYFDIAQASVKKLHEMLPDKVPDVELRRPEHRELPTGTVYYYKLPQQAGLDSQIAPNAGISEKFMVMSLAPKTTRRLLSETPPETNPVAARHADPLATAWQFSFAKLSRAVMPWIDYGFRLADGEDAETLAMRDQIKTALEVLGCLKQVSGVSYFEDKALVTHYEWQIEDLK